MRAMIKKIYMLMVHPILFWKFSLRNNLFIKSRANIKKIWKMSVGKNVSFGYDVRINFFDNTSDIMLVIGDGAYFCNRVSFLVGGKIEIGEDVLIASDVCITSENHSIDPMNDRPYKSQELICEDVKIGKGTWIGEKAIILPGVTIGEKCVIGAGSVVTKDIPSMSIAVGNPAKVIKMYDMVEHKWIKA